jgi:hypothetical protein
MMRQFERGQFLPSGGHRQFALSALFSEGDLCSPIYYTVRSIPHIASFDEKEIAGARQIGMREGGIIVYLGPSWVLF